MAANLGQPGAFRAVLLVTTYWCLILLISFQPSGLIFARQASLPIFLVGAMPIMALAALRIYRSGSLSAHSLALHDDLTGLENRRAFFATAYDLLRKAKAGNVALILLDVDGLKKINDGCGHQAGDELLVEVASFIDRFAGSAYRVGGDEFAILVNRSRGESLAALIGSLRPLTSQFQACGHEHEVHFTYGFASFCEGDSVETLFSRADSTLRRFKEQLYRSGQISERRGSQRATSSDNAGTPPAEQTIPDNDQRVISLAEHRGQSVSLDAAPAVSPSG